jgi:ABC-type transport system involved in multi-copper enzyme maturation permease subunit
VKAPAARALAWDALYQVLDNSVFRILSLLALVPVLFTFLLGFREEEVVLLFGLKRWEYGGFLDLMTAFSGNPGVSMAVEDKQGLMIEAVLQIFLENLAGTIGILFCISATAFFVPRMLEKGAADVLFHKPVSRWALYLSRYFAGLLFIGVLAVLMVVGVFLGLAVASQHVDPGILLVAFQLTYIFGLLYSVTMLIGVVTRSTVASILLTVIFFVANGCIHVGWVMKEKDFAQERIERLGTTEQEPPEDARGEQAASAGSGTEAAQAEQPRSLFLRCVLMTLDWLHFILPKTGDADYIARKLRQAVDAPLYRDEDSLVTFFRRPTDTHELEPATLDLAPALRERLGEPRLALASSGADAPPVLYSLWRRPLVETVSKIGSRARARRETLSQAADGLEQALSASAASVSSPAEPRRFGSNARGGTASASVLSWSEDATGGRRSRTAVLFRGADTKWLYTLLVDAPGELTGEQRELLLERVDRSLALDTNIMNQPSWYEKQLTLGTPLRYNILVSIGSSLAFTLAMLLLGWWRLKKIDF